MRKLFYLLIVAVLLAGCGGSSMHTSPRDGGDSVPPQPPIGF